MLPSGANLTLGTRLLFCHASESGDPEQAKPYQRRLDPRFRGGDEEEKPGAICLVHTTRLLGVMLPAMVSAALVLAPVPSSAQTVKIGMINSYTGLVAQAADQGQKGADLYVKEHEKDLPPGVKIEIFKRDDTSNPEVGKRLAQELITRDHVQLLTGIILSPVAAAVAPLTAEAKVPLVLSNAAAGVSIPRISPYVVRVTFTLWQESYPIGKWAAEQGWKTGYTAVTDFIAGHDAEAAFTKAFTDAGGKIVGADRFPLANPDFTPFVQRIKDAKPDVAFIFVPAGTQATAMMRAMQRSRPARGRDQDRLAAGPAARRGAAEYGRYTARPDHLRHLFGRGQAAGQQGLSRGLEAGIRRQGDPRFLLGRRLGRDGGDLRPDQGDQGQVHRRRGDDVSSELEEPR